MTARRRVEAPVDVPITMTLLDGGVIEDLQYRDIGEFLGLTPGVLVHPGGDGVSVQITIRGVVTPGELVEPGNAVYVDDTYVSGLRTVLPGFYDIESVQVLKGPQAGLYGRNTTGGAVLVTTGRPTDALSARVDASYTDFDDRNVNGTLNVPLSTTVLLRATAWHNDRDGGFYQDELLDLNLDASRDTGGRLSLAVLPDEHTTLRLSAEVAEIEEPVFGGTVEGARLGPVPEEIESRHNVLRDDAGGIELESTRINGTLDIDTGAGSFIAVAGWRKVEAREPGSESILDGTAWTASYTEFLADPSDPYSVLAPIVFTRDDDDESLSVELRYLTPDAGGLLESQLGLSYFEETARFSDQTAPARDLALIMAAIGQSGAFDRHTGQETESWSGFGELIWTPLEAIEITADLRYTNDRKHIDFAQTATGMLSLIGLRDAALDAIDTFANWSPGITLAYKPDDTLTIFCKYVRGFRAGGFNQLVNNPALLPYDSEEAANYELGLKAVLLERRLDLGASVFYHRIDNALVPQADPGVLAAVFPLQNAGIVETAGLELDLAARVSVGLSLVASAGAYEFEQTQGLGADYRPLVPEYTASIVADYERPLSSTVTGTARLGFRHRSGGRVAGLYEIAMDSYDLLDAQFGLRIGAVELAAFVRNALDDNFVVSNVGLSAGQARYVGAAGGDPFTTRAILHDPGAVFGVRMTVVL